MNLALGLFALSLVGAEGPRNREAPEITYEVRVLTMTGLDWRESFFARLQPVTSQGGATVWTTSRETAFQLAAKDPNGLRAPRVTAHAQAPAHFFQRTNRKVASGVKRLADGPFDHATQVAYAPNYEEIREGWAITMSGRKIDQGVLACVVLDETRVASVHHVTLTETMPAKECCADGCETGREKVASRIDVPEVDQAALAGEWLIPNDGALVLSLGVRTTADEAGKAVVVERLVLVEATPREDGALRRASLSRPDFPAMPAPAPAPVPGREPAAGQAAAGGAPMPMPMPAMPSRSLPQAMAADGSPLPLPPLPDDQAAPPSSLPGSSEPCASPQAPNRKPQGPTSLDPASTKAGFIPVPKDKALAVEMRAPARPYLVRIPLNTGNLNLEVEVRMATPARDPATPRPATATRQEK